MNKGNDVTGEWEWITEEGRLNMISAVNETQGSPNATDLMCKCEF